MLSMCDIFVASFSSPMSIGTTPQSLLFVVPLIVAISVVYKAIKLESIETKNFIKETASLVGSIFAFIVVMAIGVILFSWVIGL